MSDNPLDFTGNVALVTGAASGMGLAAARAFAEAGAFVVLADFREDVANVESNELAAAGHKVIAVRCDVSDAPWTSVARSRRYFARRAPRGRI